jgi:hypothetical protein
VDLCRERLDLQDPPDLRLYDCKTCPWVERRDRLCDLPGDGKGQDLLEAARLKHPHLAPSTTSPDSCRLRAITPEIWGWIRDYTPYERGILLRAGGLEDQPARWLAAMDLIDRRLSHHHSHPKE